MGETLVYLPRSITFEALGAFEHIENIFSADGVKIE